MRFELAFDCDNAAFEDDPRAEIRRILHDVAVKIEYELEGVPFGRRVFDANGNHVGDYELADDD